MKMKKSFRGVTAVDMRRSFRGVITVEMSYLMPLIFLLFVLVIYAVFYYHDKNILVGAASETAVLGAQLERDPDGDKTADLASFYQERIQGKLILFSSAEADISKSGDRVEVSVFAQKGWMRMQVMQRAAVVEPEKTIRRKMILENMIGQGEE